MQKAYAAGCPSICGMVSDQGEKCFSPYFLDLMTKIGKDVTTVKINFAAKSGGGKKTRKTGNRRGKKNGPVPETELQAHQVWGLGRERGL